jgi:S1-C subfamily serine protease
MGPNRQGCASGVSIDPKLVGRDVAQGAVVLTNYHVIAGMGNRPPLQLGGKGEIYRAEILRRSPQYDLALLWVPQVQFPIATLASASPAKGAIVRAIGFPNNQPLTVKDSLLLGKTRTCLAIAPCLALRQGTITFGNSGGPLEADGQIVGINQGEIADEIAIPVEQIREFLAGKNPPASRSPQFDPDFGSGDLRDRPPQFDPELPGRQPPDFLPGAPPPGYPVW